MSLTATEVIDQLAEKVMHLVEDVNSGRNLTREQFLAAFRRAFSAALPTFLERLHEQSPELAAALRSQFLVEHELRMSSAQSD